MKDNRVNVYPTSTLHRMRVDVDREFYRLQNILWGLRFTQSEHNNFYEGNFNYRSLLKLEEAVAKPEFCEDFSLSIHPVLDTKYRDWVSNRNRLLAIKNNLNLNLSDDYYKADDLWQFQRTDAKFGLEAEHALLLEEMGCGKTVIASAIVEMARKFKGVKKILIIAPGQVRTNWKYELMKWTTIPTYVRQDGLKDSHHIIVCDAAASDHRMLPLIVSQITDQEVTVIVGWDTIRLPWFDKYLASANFDMIIADEAHRARNLATSKTAKSFQNLHARFQYALTGTAIVNYPEDLFALVHWLYPDQYPDYGLFSEDFVQRPLNALRRAGRPAKPNIVEEKLDLELDYMMVRRRKVDVMKWLPSKNESMVPVELYPRQRRMYNQMRDELITILERGEKMENAKFVTASIKLTQIMRLKQLAISPATILFKDFKEITPEIEAIDMSPKFDWIIDWLEQNEDEKLVIFSQYADAIRLLENRIMKLDRFKSKEDGYVFCSGQRKTVFDQKHTDVKVLETAFQEDPRVKIWMGTLKTGGEGITLTAAANMIIIDQWWNAASMNQAADRIHRGGQTRPVQIYNLVAEDTIEQDILTLIQAKALQSAQTIDTRMLLDILYKDRNRGMEEAA